MGENRIETESNQTVAELPGAPAPASAPGGYVPLKVELLPSRQFTSWMAEQRVSLAVTTYQAGKLMLIGLHDKRRISMFERSFNRCMGLCTDGDGLWMSSLYQVWRLQNSLASGKLQDGFDRLYVPQVGYTTGDLDIHDLAVDANGRVIFVNTLYGCLATVSDRVSFVPLWKPPFLSKLAAEDRCHLNGLAMENGKPRYVTAVSQSDVADGWREGRRDGGCVVDVGANEVVATGLSMPHSPRMHKGKLWLFNSGTGHLGWVDLKSGKFERVAFCPGYMRGLSIVGDFAVIGMSKPRDRTFTGLELDDNLAKAKSEARCGLMVIDLRTGDAVHWLRIEGVVAELYDVAVLPNVVRPAALGFKTDEIRRNITIGAEQLL